MAISANDVSDQLLTFLKQTGLDYKTIETPFSLDVKIKKKFIKHFSEKQQSTSNAKNLESASGPLNQPMMSNSTTPFSMSSSPTLSSPTLFKTASLSNPTTSESSPCNSTLNRANNNIWMIAKSTSPNSTFTNISKTPNTFSLEPKLPTSHNSKQILSPRSTQSVALKQNMTKQNMTTMMKTSEHMLSNLMDKQQMVTPSVHSLPFLYQNKPRKSVQEDPSSLKQEQFSSTSLNLVNQSPISKDRITNFNFSKHRDTPSNISKFKSKFADTTSLNEIRHESHFNLDEELEKIAKLKERHETNKKKYGIK